MDPKFSDSESPAQPGFQYCAEAERSTSDNPLEGEIAVENEHGAEAECLIEGRSNQGRCLQYRAFISFQFKRLTSAFSPVSCHGKDPLKKLCEATAANPNDDAKTRAQKHIGFCMKAATFSRPSENFHAITGI